MLHAKFIFPNSKGVVICESAEFECRYIRTHPKEKQSYISKVKLAILPFLSENTKLPSCVSLVQAWSVLRSLT